MKKTFVLLIVIIFCSCTKKSELSVQNNISNSTLLNVEWGGVPLASSLLPGQTSRSLTIRSKSNFYDIDLPESNEVKFIMDVGGDRVFLQTRNLFRLDEEETLTIRLNDSTEVVNPLTDETRFFIDL